MDTTNSGRPEIGVNVVGGFKRIVIRLTLYNFAGLKGDDEQDFADFYCNELREYLDHLLAKTLPSESPNYPEYEWLRFIISPDSYYVYRTNGGIDIVMTGITDDKNINRFEQWMSYTQQNFINIINLFGFSLSANNNIPLIQVREEQTWIWRSLNHKAEFQRLGIIMP